MRDKAICDEITETLLSFIIEDWKIAGYIMDQSKFMLGKECDFEDKIISLIEMNIIELEGDASDLRSCRIKIKTNIKMEAKALKAIGFWNSEDEGVFIHPKALVGSYDDGVKERLASYLEAGVNYEQYYGESHCRFGCDELDIDMGTSDLTDGTWMWPKGLSHYVRTHNVLLPDEFLQQADKNNWKISGVYLPNTTTVDYNYWIEYCKNP